MNLFIQKKPTNLDVSLWVHKVTYKLGLQVPADEEAVAIAYDKTPDEVYGQHHSDCGDKVKHCQLGKLLQKQNAALPHSLILQSNMLEDRATAV